MLQPLPQPQPALPPTSSSSGVPDIGREIESSRKLFPPKSSKSLASSFRIIPLCSPPIIVMSFANALLGFSLFVLFSMASCQTVSSNQSTAYEMLEKFNFPKGILPEGVKSYALNPDDGSFQVFFHGDCKFGLEGGYSLSYRKKITGKVSFGSLKELKGVSVKVLFVWLNIDQVSRGNGDLAFYVGPLSASFPLSNFADSPQCGCGFDCNDLIMDS